jgi:hypothetical protein
VIIGGANPQQNPRGGGMSGGGMTFNLKLHEFDLAVALRGRSSDEQASSALLSNVSTTRGRCMLFCSLFVRFRLLSRNVSDIAQCTNSRVC